MGFIEPGSLHLDAVHLRIGGVKTANYAPLKNGNKFIVAEHFVDPDGKPVNEKQFDVSRMCYSLFISPESRSGSHERVMKYHKVEGAIGRIVGGGLLTINAGNATLANHSGDFCAEPASVRARFAALLLPVLQTLPDARDLSVVEGVPEELGDINLYWLRFRQIFEAIEKKYGDDAEKMQRKINFYRTTEADYQVVLSLQ